MLKSIALVDDDRNILTSVSLALEADGFDVNTYVAGTDAILGLSQKPADLAILDHDIFWIDLPSHMRIATGG